VTGADADTPSAPGPCQNVGDHPAPCDTPWSGTARADDKTRLYRYVLHSPEGTPLAKVVTDVFGDDTGDYTNTDYQLARRFFDRHDCFQIARRDGLLWVEPTPAAFHLTRCKQTARTQDGDGTTLSTGTNGDDPNDTDTSNDGSNVPPAKERAQSLLSKVSTVGTDSTRASLLRALATELGSVEDRYAIMERVRGSGPEYLLCPYKNRFNAPDRVADLRSSYRRAWRRARREYDDAVCVTLTTDPALHDSIADATDALLANKNRLAQWLSYDPDGDDRPSRPGYTPPNLYALEFTDSGLPHLHVVFFGVRWLTTQAALSRYWGDRRGQGRIVHVRQVRKRGGEFVLRTPGQVDPTTDGDGVTDGVRTARQYLGKGLATLADVASLSPSDVADAADRRQAGDATGDRWKLALYWATGKQFWGGSPSLTTDPDGSDDDDTGSRTVEGGTDGPNPGVDAGNLPHVPCYRFVGVAQYGNIPAHVRQSAVTLSRSDARGRPPP